MTTIEKADDKISYEQFQQEWLTEIESATGSPLEKGRRFATKLITQWLGITTHDEDFFVCDGPGDGGIDIAYLQRADNDIDAQSDDGVEGDTWYIVQSKYGTAFSGSDTLLREGNKVIETLRGYGQNLSTDSQQLLHKLEQFQQQASESDRIILVFATTDPMSQKDRETLGNLKLIGRKKVGRNFDVEEVSLKTIWEALEENELVKLTVDLKGQFVEQSSGLLVGTVVLTDLFSFLKAYQFLTGNLDQLYEKNVRQFLGNRRKINKGIAATLSNNPEKFGLYNNGITIVVSNYSRTPEEQTVKMNDPYVVNGCQTTRTIWQILDSKLNAGGTGSDDKLERWKESVSRGGVVTKIVRSDEAEIQNITRFTNSQNSVREQDFIALNSSFRNWKEAMASEYRIFLEIQRGGIDARKAHEKQHPDLLKYSDYVNAFDLIKAYGAGWLSVPGRAFSKNAPFLPKGSIFERITNRPENDVPFGARDLYAAYKIKCVADEIGFGRSVKRPSRRQTRFLFYHIIIQMLRNVLLLTPEFEPPVLEGTLTDAVIKLTSIGAEEHLPILSNAAITLVDQYLTVGSPNSAHNEKSFDEIHNGDLNAFLKSEHLGTESHSPLLVQLLAQHNLGFASIPMPMYEGTPTQREFVAQALTKGD